jgi:hypothetical protein
MPGRIMISASNFAYSDRKELTGFANADCDNSN